jgi:hypothetical protein
MLAASPLFIDFMQPLKYLNLFQTIFFSQYFYILHRIYGFIQIHGQVSTHGGVLCSTSNRRPGSARQGRNSEEPKYPKTSNFTHFSWFPRLFEAQRVIKVMYYCSLNKTTAQYGSTEVWSIYKYVYWSAWTAGHECGGEMVGHKTNRRAVGNERAWGSDRTRERRAPSAHGTYVKHKGCRDWV